MTTEQVNKMHCDRCKRVEEKPVFAPLPTAAVAPLPSVTNFEPQVWTGMTPTPAFTATIYEESPKFGDPPKARIVSFQDLCAPCKRTVSALLEQIGKKIDGLSPERKERAAKKEVASSSKATSKKLPPVTPLQPGVTPARG